MAKSTTAAATVASSSLLVTVTFTPADYELLIRSIDSRRRMLANSHKPEAAREEERLEVLERRLRLKKDLMGET